MAEAAIKEGDPRFKFGPTKVQTAEDAALAYMRGEITEEEFKDACGRFGVLPGQLLKTNIKGERPDNAFENKIPDEIYEAQDNPVDTVETRQKIAEIKQNARDEASKAHDEAVAKQKPDPKIENDKELQEKLDKISQKEDEELSKVVEKSTHSQDSSTSKSTSKSDK